MAVKQLENVRTNYDNVDDNVESLVKTNNLKETKSKFKPKQKGSLGSGKF
jgi:hypothetical protein